MHREAFCGRHTPGTLTAFVYLKTDSLKIQHSNLDLTESEILDKATSITPLLTREAYYLIIKIQIYLQLRFLLYA